MNPNSALGGGAAPPFSLTGAGDMEDTERDEQERPRPRVVDKRVTARPPGATPEAEAPAAEIPTPAPPPPPSSETFVPPGRADTPPAGARDTPVWTPEQEEEARRMVEEIRRVSSTDWVLSSLMTLVNVASVKLEASDLAESQLAIDALAGILDSVGSRLGDNEAPLRQVLTQLKMAYSQAAMPEPGTGP
ncbi:MAG: hypothetical protein ACRDJV_01400 [Actinomycetota bacterium]